MAEFLAKILPFLTASPTLTPTELVGFWATRVIGAVFLLCYAYQIFYIIVAAVKRPRTYPAAEKDKRYAVLVAARNEEAVLPSLLESIKGQTYPGELIDVYVVADNCTDNTAQAARACGAFVYERTDKERVGKGYALAYLIENMKHGGQFSQYDAFFVFDADNLLRADYVEQMHNAFAAGNRILTSYRNSKNYGKNWISAGYSLWFLREARQLNAARSILGSSASITGTGFLVAREVIEQNGGWKHFLLTEDIEFTADSVLAGEKIAYCHAAEFFDEQPERFRPSCRQRKRWARGLFQVIRHYGARLLAAALRGSWSSFDMLVCMMPAFLLSTLQLGVILVLLLLHALLGGGLSLFLFSCFVEFWVCAYALFFFVGACTLLSEWRRILCKKWRAVLLLFTFPVFMLTYIPISVAALFGRVEWKPIPHRYAISTDELQKK